MRTVASVLLAFGMVTCLPVFTSAAIIDLGDAADYAILAMPDGADDPDVRLFASVKITGDVAIGTDGSFRMFSSGPGKGIFGDVHLESGVVQDISGSADISGSVFTNVDLSLAIADALAASSAADALAATQTFGSITDSTIWNATALDGINVIDVDDIDLGAVDQLTLNGSAEDFFIINISGVFDMTGSSKIVTSGGILPGHVLFNFPTSGDNIRMSAVALAEGTFLAPHRDAVWDGHLVNGAIIANDVRLGSSAYLVHIPFGGDDVPPPTPPVIPEPATGLLMAFGLAAFRRSKKR